MREVAPFFRIPGLDRSDLVETELAARALAVFSSDTVADDWHHRIKPAQIIALALQRLEARGKGILLLHDIHPTTVAALPGLLKELKDKGFRVVQVVPATSAQIAVAGKPKSWMVASAMPGQLTVEAAAAPPSWPKSHDSDTLDDVTLPAPDASAFEPDAGLDIDSGGKIQWPEQPAAAASSDAELPAPRAAESSAHPNTPPPCRSDPFSRIRAHQARTLPPAPPRDSPRRQRRQTRRSRHQNKLVRCAIHGGATALM